MLTGLPAPDRYAHGTRARYNAARCRCLPCRRANARYEMERQSRPFNGLVPAAPAQAHLFALSAQGVGYKSAADAASVARSVVAKIRSGERTQVRAQTAARILAVDAQAVADGALVSAEETWRLLDDLRAQGYPKRRLALLMGSQAKDPALQVRTERIQAKTALRVRRLYDALTAEGEDIETERVSPRVQILAALARFDWVSAEHLFDALGVASDDRPRFTKALSRLAADGVIARRGAAYPFEYTTEKDKS